MKTKIKTKKNFIEFKSIPEMFEKEKSGRKPNTLRIVNLDDERFDLLKDKKVSHITIQNTETKEEFTRKITDITLWNGQFIISWDNQAVEQERKRILEIIDKWETKQPIDQKYKMEKKGIFYNIYNVSELNLQELKEQLTEEEKE